MTRSSITGRLGRLERAGARALASASASRCGCCAGIDFRTGEGEWAPCPKRGCILFHRDDGRTVGWCKRCAAAISAVFDPARPRGQGGPWRVSAARPDQLPV